MSLTTTELRLGQSLEAKVCGPVTKTDIVRYAGASGDFNPIHHDEEFAASAGFPSVFSIGMYQAGLLANFAADVFGPDHLRRIRCRFAAQVWPGDVLTCTGAVTKVNQTDDGTEVDVELACTRRGPNGDEAVAVTGSATFVVP